ncbi:hypothetical protein K438DRAFT_1780712 [Mycena galopus ATCC 62051]|nr:hypothetical protein K438DRAFT_1780712 [Mycena galopus ATCC 62051]
MSPSRLPPLADRQDYLSAPVNISDPPSHAADLNLIAASIAPPMSPDVTLATSAEQEGSGDQRKRGGVCSGALPSSRLPPLADRQDSVPAPVYTSDAPSPISLAEIIPIAAERPLTPPTDSEIDNVISSSPPWREPDRYGIQMGNVQRAYPVLCVWIRAIFRTSVVLGTKPTPYKANTATLVHKAGKKDKTSPKAWRPVENFEHVLAKPLERLIADHLSFDAESMNFLDNAQYGGRPGHT